MKKSILIAVFFAIVTFVKAQERPNIIFILTDDQSYDLLGCTGNDIVQTPNIDKMAGEGILFTNAHITSAICTPSRISILLSQYERKHGVNFNSGTSVSDEAWAESYPMVFRNNGYFTGWIGKNHAPVGDGGYDSGLMEKSFDYWYAGHGHLGFYPKDRHKIFNDAVSFTQPEIITEGVNDFIDNNERKLKGAIRFLDVRPTDKPFMLSVNFNLPHGASTSTMKMKATDDEIYKTLYRDLKIPLPPNYIAKKDIKTPKLPADLLKAEDRQDGYNYADTPEESTERYIREMEAMTGIDRMVGNLRAKLKALKLDKNTIIIFASDHGLYRGEHGLGGKALCYEKTTHIPMIVFDPRVSKKSKGLKSDALVQSIDIAPTMLKMAGIKVPEVFQGKDISALINGGKDEVRKYVYTENLWSTHFGNPRIEAVQTKEWKYLRYYKNNNFSATKEVAAAKLLGMNPSKMLYAVHDPEIAVYRDYIDSSMNGEQPVYEELYNIKNDPNEVTNLINNAAHNSILKELKAAWAVEIKNARGTGKPRVLRYTNDSHPNAGH